MSTLLRLFSPSYRYALKAEAEGRYIEAARAFALCGQRRKVAEMHLLEAEMRGSPASALRELQVAAHFLAEEAAASRGPLTEANRMLLWRVGQAYFKSLQKSVLSAADRPLCAEAAELLLRGGDPVSAAAAYELGGDVERAAATYQQAGEVEKVEALLGAQEEQRRRAHAERAHFDAYRTHLDLGQRDEALAELYACVESTALADRAEPLRLYEELRERLLEDGVVRLCQVPAAATTTGDPGPAQIYVGALPLRIGRDPGCALVLRDPGVSREHAQIERSPDGGFALRELSAKNHTTLGGLPLQPGAALPLHGEGEMGLGSLVRLRFAVAGPLLRLQVEQGMERGLVLHASSAEAPLPLGGDARAAPLEVVFSQQRPLLRTTMGAAFLLNGRRAPPQVQLIRGDLIELGELRLEVM